MQQLILTSLQLAQGPDDHLLEPLLHLSHLSCVAQPCSEQPKSASHLPCAQAANAFSYGLRLLHAIPQPCVQDANRVSGSGFNPVVRKLPEAAGTHY